MFSINSKGLEGILGHFKFQEPSITNNDIPNANPNNNPSAPPIADPVNETSTAQEVYPLVCHNECSQFSLCCFPDNFSSWLLHH